MPDAEKKPTPPPTRIVEEGVSTYCKKCSSTLVRNKWYDRVRSVCPNGCKNPQVTKEDEFASKCTDQILGIMTLTQYDKQLRKNAVWFAKNRKKESD